MINVCIYQIIINFSLFNPLFVYTQKQILRDENKLKRNFHRLIIGSIGQANILPNSLGNDTESNVYKIGLYQSGF